LATFPGEDEASRGTETNKHSRQNPTVGGNLGVVDILSAKEVIDGWAITALGDMT